MKWDGRYVAGVSKVGVLKKTTEVVKHRDGGDPSTSRKSPGRTEFEAITLERGVTHDPEFENWANKVWNFGAGLGAEVSLKDFRKDIIIEVYNEAGQKVIAYKVYRCWVSEYQALPDLDANANAVAIQHLKLENEGWERDASVTEPTEPTVQRLIRGRCTARSPWTAWPTPTCSSCGRACGDRRCRAAPLRCSRWRRRSWRAQQLAALSLGERERRLLALHARCFGAPAGLRRGLSAVRRAPANSSSTRARWRQGCPRRPRARRRGPSRPGTIASR